MQAAAVVIALAFLTAVLLYVAYLVHHVEGVLHHVLEAIERMERSRSREP